MEEEEEVEDQYIYVIINCIHTNVGISIQGSSTHNVLTYSHICSPLNNYFSVSTDICIYTFQFQYKLNAIRVVYNARILSHIL